MNASCPTTTEEAQSTIKPRRVTITQPHLCRCARVCLCCERGVERTPTALGIFLELDKQYPVMPKGRELCSHRRAGAELGQYAAVSANDNVEHSRMQSDLAVHVGKHPHKQSRSVQQCTLLESVRLPKREWHKTGSNHSHVANI